jgi:DNA-binding response OmpR family regulator
MSIATYVPDQLLFAMLRDILMRAGYRCEPHATEAALLKTLLHGDVDLVLLDLSAASEHREQLFEWLRMRHGERIPVLALSSGNRHEVAAFTLNSGADDFLGIPFDPHELLARMRALMRRCRRQGVRRQLIVGGFVLDSEDNSMQFQGMPIILTSREFAMAWLLFSSPGKFIARDTIGTVVWGRGGDIAGRTIEQHIYKLRKKLMRDEEPLALVRTAYGQGYRLELCYES